MTCPAGGQAFTGACPAPPFERSRWGTSVLRGHRHPGAAPTRRPDSIFCIADWQQCSSPAINSGRWKASAEAGSEDHSPPPAAVSMLSSAVTEVQATAF
jgi:hypothetical protein